MSIIKIQGSNKYNFENTKSLGNRVNNKFSLVYKGININTKQNVIIKKLNPNLLNNNDAIFRFKEEGKHIYNHENLQQIIEAFYFENNYYIILNFIEGIDLKTFSLHNKKLLRTDYSVVKKIFTDILLGLQVIHDNGYVHGDIKPANIIISENNGEYKATLIDFGQVRESCKRIYSKDIPFSLLYSSPEQVIKANSIVNNKSDIYSVGITLYEVLTGEYPYNNSNPLKLMILQLNYNIQPHKYLSPDIYKIIKKATAKFIFPRPYRYYSKTEVYVMLVKGQNRRFNNVNEFIETLNRIY